MSSTNRFFNDSFNAPFGSLAKSVPLDVQFQLLQVAFALVQAELDALAGIQGITSLPGFPASFAGAALRYLRVNAAESAIEFVTPGGLRIKTIGGTSYTLLAADAGCLLIFTNSSAVSVTVNSGTLAQGEVVCIRQGAAGQVTLVAGSGVTLNSSDSLLSTRTLNAQIALISDDGAAAFGVIGERNAPSTGVALLAQANVFTKGQIVTPVLLTDGASIATDASLSNHFTVTLGGNRTLANPSNLTNGIILNWKVKQDGTGSRTLAYGSKFKWASGAAPTLTTTAGATDYISGHYFSDDDIIVCAIMKGLA